MIYGIRTFPPGQLPTPPPPPPPMNYRPRLLSPGLFPLDNYPWITPLNNYCPDNCLLWNSHQDNYPSEFCLTDNYSWIFFPWAITPESWPSWNSPRAGDPLIFASEHFSLNNFSLNNYPQKTTSNEILPGANDNGLFPWKITPE